MKTRKEGMKQILSANLGVKRYDAKHTDRSTENSASAIFTARCGRHRRLADRICTDASDIGIYDLTVRGTAEWSDPICTDEIRKIAILYFQGLRWSVGWRNYFPDRLCGVRVAYGDSFSIVKYGCQWKNRSFI